VVDSAVEASADLVVALVDLADLADQALLRAVLAALVVVRADLLRLDKEGAVNLVDPVAHPAATNKAVAEVEDNAVAAIRMQISKLQLRVEINRPRLRVEINHNQINNNY
jgi:CelD/BcsL family acetyltransferase involved in cellulose biosynthesis